jgi:hypothetical protein
MVLRMQQNLGRQTLVCLTIVCIASTLLWPGWSAAQKELDNYEYNARPHIQYCSVWARNNPGGMQTALDVGVADPDGSVPSTIASLTANGPNGFSYTFTSADYYGFGEYYHAISGVPEDGLYTFTVTDIGGYSATSFFTLTKGEVIPVPDNSTMQASGSDSLTPTLSWTTVQGYSGSLFYRAKIVDVDGRDVWNSPRNFNVTSVVVPGGLLSLGRSYKWRVDVYDNFSGANSDDRASSRTVPLLIDNTRAYFNAVGVSKIHTHEGSYTTGLIATGGDPSDSVSSLVVTGPGGFLYTFNLDQQCVDQPNSLLHMCVGQMSASPTDGNYTFTLTNASGTVASHFYLNSYDVPLVDPSTCRASGNPLSPVLSWAVPSTVDRPLYYVAAIYDDSYKTVWSSIGTTLTSTSTGITQTSVGVPSGILKSGISYFWQVVASDSKYVYSSNKSFSSGKALTIDNSAPYFTYATVYDGNDPGGAFIGINVRVGDQNGTIPGSIASLVVDGPEGFSYAFQPADYSATDNVYFKRISGTPPVGLYTFTATKTNGHSAVTYWYHRVGGGTIPLLDESSFDVSGDPAAPTISWSTVTSVSPPAAGAVADGSGYPYHLYYRVQIINQNGKVVFTSPFNPSSFVAVPWGTLTVGTSYQYRIEAADSPDYPGLDSRVLASYLAVPQLPTPAAPGKATLVSPPPGTISSTKPVFSWSPVPQAGRYFLWVDDATGNKIKQWFTAPQAGCGDGNYLCSVAPGISLAMGRVTFYVQAENSGGVGPWSDARVFNISPPAPGKAQLISPSGAIGTTTPTYMWKAVPDSTWYYLYVDDSTGGRITDWYTPGQANCAGGSGNCSVTPGIVLAAGQAKWWIQTWNAGGSNWSDGMSFTVPAPVKPGKATLISPSGSVDTPTIAFTWNPASNADYYYLLVSDASGTKIAQWYAAALAHCENGVATCYVTPDAALLPGLYTWWVRTWNPNGFGDWSNSLQFTAPAPALPGKAVLISPSGAINTTTPHFTWNADAASTWYYLFVNDSTGNRIRQWTTAEEAGCPTGAGTCSVEVPETVLASGAGNWWVRTWNPNGFGPWSDGKAFTVPTPVVPGKVALIAPSSTIGTVTPTYTWNADAQASYYYLWVNDSSGTKIKQWYSADQAGCGAGTGSCSVTPATTLAPGSAIWWIDAWNPNGFGSWSDGMPFAVILTSESSE